MQIKNHLYTRILKTVTENRKTILCETEKISSLSQADGLQTIYTQ